MYPILDKYHRGDQNRTQICTEFNIAPHTFNYWLTKYRKDRHRLESNFIDVAVVHEKDVEVEEMNAGRAIRVHYPDGTLIEIPI